MGAGWVSNWEWGLFLIVLTMIVHAFALVALASALTRSRLAERPGHSVPRVVIIATLVIGVTGMVLAAIHGLEATLWAVLYVALGAIPDLHDALYYSIDSLTTRGKSGLTLPPEWRLLGAVESIAGVLQFGASAAFLFAVMQRAWLLLAQAHDDPRERT